MLTAFALLALLASDPGAPATYHGRRGELQVTPPRIEASVTVDGALDEPVWKQAVVLTGFSQFSPKDGIAALDSTEVLVWYSPTAIHFGVRAFEAHGEVHATLAERDKVDADDYVQFLIGTFNDGRQATVFMVNPLGVQADGVLTETGSTGAHGFSATQSRESADLSPDFVFQSKGRVTPWGYEIEVRIPFKSLKYQSTAKQTWGLNVVRRVQHSGYEDSWAPAKRASASFLAQSGSIAGLTDIRRGVVFDVTPEITDRLDGAPSASTGKWAYAHGSPDVGANVRWGITNNLTLNGTVKPDFSQVEADAQQFQYDPRKALSYAEKRPFFLDGIEQFTTPNGLVYTRRIVQPMAAVKVAGKVGGTNVGFLSAIDDAIGSTTGHDRPVFNLLRASRDFGPQARVGLLYTDRVDGENSNRVFDLDSRFIHNKIYQGALQVAVSNTHRGGRSYAGPLFDIRLARNGRSFAMNASLTGTSPDFNTESGFTSRVGEVHGSIAPRYTIYFPAGSFVENVIPSVSVDGDWFYTHFTRRMDARDKHLYLNLEANLRGGWNVGLSEIVETFGYDPYYYGALYRILSPRPGGGADTLPFTGTPRLPNRDWVARVVTPKWRAFSGDLQFIWGQDENFYEWASGDIVWVTVNAYIRPTERLRVTATYNLREFDRLHGRGTVGVQRTPRLKLEYQLTRALFVRAIGEYASNEVRALFDESRTGLPLLQRSGSGWVRATGYSSNALRADWLVKYQPQPGTVFYVGYGARMTEPQRMRFEDLTRRNDALFVKMSYLFRR